jgi:uncharacterized protein (TIGR03435 family)
LKESQNAEPSFPYDIELAPFVTDSILKNRGVSVAPGFEAPDYFQALQSGLEQLGLTLQMKRASKDLLVVEHVESLPAGK